MKNLLGQQLKTITNYYEGSILENTTKINTAMAVVRAGLVDLASTTLIHASMMIAVPPNTQLCE